jgi:peptidoglycan/xylan/chitin deacetylase (PgdA/CDA1 family)
MERPGNVTRQDGAGGSTAAQMTIVMYHYVRDLARSAFPRIKGLTVDGFRHQLDYIARYYEVIRMEDLLAAVTDGAALPPNALLLTFDDGFSDHYQTVSPLLAERGWQGSFFPCTQPLMEQKVLDVHKIHFVLATVDDAGRLVRELDQLLAREIPGGTARPTVDEVHRYDQAAVTTFKRLLQRELPRPVRERLVDHFFRRYVTQDEAAFARELYASVDQLREMRAAGMYLGCHGHTHVWFDHLTPDELEDELHRSLTFLAAAELGAAPWVMCYPYGGYAPNLAPAMRRHGCAAGLLAEPGIADIASDAALALPRLDTNDLPQQPVTVPAVWTRRVLEGA